MLFKDHFQTQYDEALAGDDPLKSYNVLAELEKSSQNEGYELEEVLEIEWTDFDRQKGQFLYDASDELIEKTNKMVDEGNPFEAYDEFCDYFSSVVKPLEDTGHDFTKIKDHKTRLLKVKTKSEFDKAISQDSAFAKANQLEKFAPGGIMNGEVLDKLFGEDEANKMRGIAKNAFIEVARDALHKYEAGGDESDLLQAEFWRADKFLEWSDITDNVEALKARVERNGHQLTM